MKFKKSILLFLPGLMLVFTSYAQVNSALLSEQDKRIFIDQKLKKYEEQKNNGTLNPALIHQEFDFSSGKKITPKVTSPPTSRSGSPAPMTITECDCWIPRDSTFSIVPFSGALGPEYRNDDLSTDPISIPFTFCFYGTSFNELYINNNGNISFNTPYSTFSADSFPSTTYSMIAPFWGDVDTRNTTSGLVYYKITPTALIVQWDSVGYYSQQIDKHNTFQVIITNGLDPLIPNSNNVAFCYKDMQWTTGSASCPFTLDNCTYGATTYSCQNVGATGGFCGVPATVGANRGDGASFVQYGRFNHPGIDYDGPFVGSDGVSWLDNWFQNFNTCVISNLPPSISGLSPCNYDTIYACLGDTTVFSVSFFSPEAGQITHTNATCPTFSNYTITDSVPANAPTITIEIIPTPADIGNHIITFTGTDNGAPSLSSTADVILSVVAALPVDAGLTDTICLGDSVQLNLVTVGTNISWTPTTGLSDPTIANPWASPTNTTMYYAFASDGGICGGVDSVLVMVSNDLANAGPNQTLCTGFTTTLNACFGSICQWSWAPATGLSDPNICNPTANPAVNTTYTLTTTSCFSGCVSTDQITITVVPTLPADAGPSQVICDNDSAQLNASGGVVYSWSPGTGLSNTGISNPTSLPSSSVLYTVTVVDATGCTGTDTMSVTPIPAPTVDAGLDTSYCIGNSTVLSGSGNGVSFFWDTQNNLSDSLILNPVANPTTSTYFKLTMVAPNNCPSTDSVLVTVFPLPVISAGADAGLCVGSNITLNASAPTGTYTWSPATNLSSTSLLNPTANPASTITYYLQVTDTNGCVNTDSVLVTVYNLPTVNAGNDQTICSGSFAQLSGSGTGTSFLWSPSTGLSASNISSPKAVALSTTTYTLTITDANNCSNTDEVKVNVGSNPLANNVQVQDEKCGDEDGAISIPDINGGVSPFSYSINNGTFQSSNIFSGLTEGDYIIQIKDASGCVSTQTIHVNKYLGIEAGFSSDPVSGGAPLLVNFTNSSTGASNYIWDFGDETGKSEEMSPSHTFDKGGMFEILLIARNKIDECADTANGIIAVIDLMAPNVFTPFDIDGKNDNFVVRTDGLSSIAVSVFNRWGKKIAGWSEIGNGWDGKTNSGSNADDGVYYYTVSAISLDGTEYKQHGFFHLVSTH